MLVFHPQTNLEAFQDIFPVYLAAFKFEMLLCMYVICSEQKMVLNIWVVFKTDKIQSEYLPVAIRELFSVFKKFRISNSLQSLNYFILSSGDIHVLTAYTLQNGTVHGLNN